MLTFLLIVAAELIVLFRLALPDFIAWAEARHDAVYQRPESDCFPAMILDDFHLNGVCDE